MTGLPKAIIKKYGVTKKAWAVFRGQKTSPSRTVKRSRIKKTAVYRMAKRKRFGRRSSSKAVGGKMKPLLDAAISGAIVGALLKVVPQQYNTTMTRVVAGGAAAYMGSGYIKKSGELLVAIEAARLTNNAVSGITQTSSASSVQLY